MIEPKKIIRTKRSTIALIVDTNGELIVRAPYYASDDEIESLVAQEQVWIEQKTVERRKQKEERPALQVKEGEFISYLGKECPIYQDEEKSGYFDGEAFHLPKSGNLKIPLSEWYKRQAHKILKERVSIYAEKMGVAPTGVSITSAKTRWGSCSGRNHLNFSWHLIMCPLDVVDYVVVHELCHIWHKDHSRDFWNSVGEYDREYKAHEQYLKDNRRFMEII